MKKSKQTVDRALEDLARNSHYKSKFTNDWIVCLTNFREEKIQ